MTLLFLVRSTAHLSLTVIIITHTITTAKNYTTSIHPQQPQFLSISGILSISRLSVNALGQYFYHYNLTNCSMLASRANKENQYYHQIPISPEKQKKGALSAFQCNGNVQKRGKELEELTFSPTKQPKPLSLWLQPVLNLNTSLDEIVGEDEECIHGECDCPKEHILE